MSLKRAKSANDTITNAVFGFIREHEKKESVMAPAMIKYLVLNYYLIKETFTVTNNGARSIKMKEGTTVAEMKPVRGVRCLYGNIEVDATDESTSEYVWTLQFILHQLTSIWGPHYLKIGLADIGKSDIEFGVLISSTLSYAERIVESEAKWGEEIPTLDPQAKAYVVQMRLNIIGKKLSFFVNGASVVILQGSNGLDAFLQRKSKLCVRLSSSTKMVKLLDFSIKQR